MKTPPHDLQKLLEKGSVTVAKSLIGWRFYVIEQDGSHTGGVITETEAYTEEDAASHSYRGRTPRTEIMFGPACRLYVYFTYGMHWCVNIVTGLEGHGEAVLLRAIVPDSELDRIQQRRGNRPNTEFTNGPAKLCQALGIIGTDNGAVLNEGRFLLLPPKQKVLHIETTKRIGISKDAHRLWRFVTTDLTATN
jgi:DNA-3-methyladenine glycosylase